MTFAEARFEPSTADLVDDVLSLYQCEICGCFTAELKDRVCADCDPRCLNCTHRVDVAGTYCDECRAMQRVGHREYERVRMMGWED